jgi:hypothetical protein
MNRTLEASRYELPLSKQHESRMQHLRYEQKSEGHRLELLKKTLQAKLHAGPKESKEVPTAA